MKVLYNFLLSNFLFSKKSLNFLFTDTEKNFHIFPKIYLQTNIKYSPEYYSLNFSELSSFFLFFLKMKKSIMQITQSKILIKNFYFFSKKKAKLKFRKRKNIYFNLTLFSKIPYNFFEFITLFQLFLNLKIFLEKMYNLDCFEVFYEIGKDTIKLHISNFHLFFAFIQDATFETTPQFFTIIFDFRKTTDNLLFFFLKNFLKKKIS